MYTIPIKKLKMNFEEVKSALMWDVLPAFNKNLASCREEKDL